MPNVVVRYNKNRHLVIDNDDYGLPERVVINGLSYYADQTKRAKKIAKIEEAEKRNADYNKN